ERIKVNDADGNPVEIAAVVVWRVRESAKAVFDVDDYEEFVGIQAETALRNLATRYPYDSAGEERASLRENPDELAAALKVELEERLEVAGVDVLEARLTHLAYAPEIAQAMLRRQQAQAVVSARRLIGEAAGGMVEDALTGLGERGVVDLDREKRAAMANNLMVALTSEQASTPIINAGTLYGCPKNRPRRTGAPRPHALGLGGRAAGGAATAVLSEGAPTHAKTTDHATRPDRAAGVLAPGPRAGRGGRRAAARGRARLRPLPGRPPARRDRHDRHAHGRRHDRRLLRRRRRRLRRHRRPHDPRRRLGARLPGLRLGAGRAVLHRGDLHGGRRRP